MRPGSMPRIAALVAAAVALAAVALFGLGAGGLLMAKGTSNYLEDQCADPPRLPAGVNSFEPPRWVSPGSWRCEYPGHGSVTYSDWQPFWTTTLGVLAALAWIAVLVAAWTILARSTRRRAHA